MTNRDLYTITLNDYHEASGEPNLGIKAVTWVVLNRCKKRHLTAYQVVYQPYQFSWTLDKKKRDFNPLLNDTKEYKRLRLLAKSAILEHDNGERFYGADHYHADWIETPYWVAGMSQRVAHIGQHIFYRS